MTSPSRDEQQSPNSVQSGELHNEREAALKLGLSVATLRRRRRRRQPPAWVKLGSRVLYRQKDLDAFVEANLVRPSSGGSQQ